MRIGLQIPNFTWPGGPAVLGPKLAAIAHDADEAGYDSIWVMDHFFQIPPNGAAEQPMLEAYTTLGFLAGVTKRATLGTMVTGVTYRNPGMLAKQVTTLDVLSGGRAWLGIGAAWFEREHVGLGFEYPPLRERFLRLEEAILIAKQMWDGTNTGPFQGTYYQLAETLGDPLPIQKPHPPILIGGSGERKTLRLVAKYAQACNLVGVDPATAARKFAVLREHCEAVGRDYDSIFKSVLCRMDPGPKGEKAGEVLDLLGRYAEAGAQGAMGALINVQDMAPIEAMATRVIPEARRL
ncbi:MAG: LLM class F420-dependent oxidoreductase [Dehalococcoidia bacterium]|nr:LLM class F420-dependent oxidoreductase [Dehalococcoidia bacterium]